MTTSGRRNRDALIGLALAQRGITLAEAQPADLVIARSTGIIGWLIRVGTRSKWNHIAVIVQSGPTAETTFVVQAEAHGVLLAPLSSVAPGGQIAILPCPLGLDRPTVVAAARSMLRTKYAFVSCVSIAMSIIARLLHIPLRFAVRDTSTLICSAVGAIALLAGGWLPALSYGDLYQVTPAQLVVTLTGLDS